MYDKKMKNLILTALTAVCLVILYTGITIYQNSAIEKEKLQSITDEMNAIVLSLSPEQIAGLSFGDGDQNITLVHKGQEWIDPNDPDFQISAGRLKLLTDDLSALKAVRKITDPDDLSQYGFDSDSMKIRIDLTDNSSKTITLGTRNQTTRQVYFMVDDQDTVYVTDTAIDNHYSATKVTLAQYEEFPAFTPMELKQISVQNKTQSYLIDLPGDNTCTVTDGNGKSQSADLNRIGIIENQLSNITWAENLEYACSDYSKYGLDAPGSEIEITYQQDGELHVLKLYVGDLNDKNNYYVRMNDSAQVHSIRSEYLDQLAEGSASDFWNLSYSYVSIGDVDLLEVTYEGKTYKLTFENITSADQAKYYLDGVEKEKALVTDFYYACASVTAQERLEEVPELTVSPVLSLKYCLKDQTEKIISYYPADQNFYLVVYENGTKAAHTNKIHVNTMIDLLAALTA